MVAHGIGLQEGRSLGLWSFWGALLMCVGVVVLVLGVLMPLFGLSVLVVLALDHLVVRRVPVLAGWFGSVS